MRILTFLSDFGAGSPYPAAMKAAAAAICDAVMVDISHDLPPQAIRGGAYLLWSVAPVFPSGSVHCAVIDPGVGTARAALAVVSGSQVFVGPDNGLLLPAAHRLGTPAVYRLTNPAYWRSPVSATFHGRDVFAPAAAHIIAGASLERMGERAETYVDLTFPAGGREGNGLRGEVLWIDRFGNLITTIPGPLLGTLPAGSAVTVETGAARVHARVAHTFADAAQGEAVVLVGSDDMIEVAVTGGSAAARTGGVAGSVVRIRPA